jgi:hypothetical protein
MFQHPNKDFQLALVQKGRFKPVNRGQVQSLLRHQRFIDWIASRDHDLILVDANIRAAGLGISVTSVFCAEFVAGMIKIHPDEIITHFFCAMHMNRGDPWYGPNGLVRSIIMQLLMKLVNSHNVSLDFIDNRDYLLALEQHDLDSLCTALWQLVSQFPLNTTVYCIIDSISSFDKDSTFADLRIVLRWLQTIVDDRYLGPAFKVLMTNPMQSTRRLKRELKMQQNQKHNSRLVNLSPSNRLSVGISSRVIESHLLRPSTPTLRPSQEMFRPMSRRGYQDEIDEGWNTE